MNKIKRFEEYLEKGVARKCNPDLLRAKDIIGEVERDLDFLNEIKKKISLNDKNANNFIGQVHNILIELLRAKMLIDGYKASGPAAHEAEVSYMINLKFSEAEAEFMDTLRYSRNQILYYGKRFDADYAKKAFDFLGRIYLKLRKMLN